MQSLHTPACDRYLTEALADSVLHNLAATWLSTPDAEIWPAFYEMWDDDHGTSVEPFLLGLFHLLTPEVTR